ncbi:MAG: PIN domain-containing protein [Saprospiraceae bacterium]|nr:PIN domain-containing protein [Saprospiraceae bacterium]
MSATKDKSFWDSNLWVYLNTSSARAADRIKKSKLEKLLVASAEITISVQVLNEIANVLIKKYGQSESEILTRLEALAKQTEIVALTESISFQALSIKSKYKIGWFDSLIVAAALHAECSVLYSEDLQDGLVIDGRLKVTNPIKP